jgi:hypothetical protein
LYLSNQSTIFWTDETSTPAETMKLPRPNDQLAGCVWLPRLLAKGRQLRAGALPEDYAARFCHPTGMDGQFLAHFSLTREDILQAAALPDDTAARWFLSRVATGKIEEWNQAAPNFGRAGFPMAERLPVALSTTYKHLAGRGFKTVFEVLTADESEPQG